MTLDATQRCDRCGAQAVVTCDSLNWMTSLLFCGHHFMEHRAELYRLGVVMVDDREQSVSS